MDVADPPTDAALAARRDAAAFDQLLDRHARPLAAWLLRRLSPADAEDLFPAILHRARRAGGSFRNGDYRAWLFQLARSSLAQWMRRFPRSNANAPGDADRPPLLPAMPDDPVELSSWLERHVAGPDLA